MIFAPKQTKAVPSTAPSVPDRAGVLQPAGLTGQCEECQKDEFLETRRIRLQKKLAIGEPADHYEQEADRIAAQVLAGQVRRPSRNGAADISRVGHGPVSPTTGPTNVPQIVHEV